MSDDLRANVRNAVRAVAASHDTIKTWFEDQASASGITVPYRCPDDHVTEWVFPGPQIADTMPCSMIVEDLDKLATAADFLGAPICNKDAVRDDVRGRGPALPGVPSAAALPEPPAPHPITSRSDWREVPVERPGAERPA